MTKTHYNFDGKYDLKGWTFQFDEIPENSEEIMVTDMLPQKVCIEGWHPRLGFIRSTPYWTPRFLASYMEDWKKEGVEDFSLIYVETGLRVFGD